MLTKIASMCRNGRTCWHTLENVYELLNDHKKVNVTFEIQNCPYDMNTRIVVIVAATCHEELELPKQSLRHPLRQLCCRFVQVFTCEARVQQTAYMRNDRLVQVHITPLRYQPICRRRNIFPDPTCEACFRQSSCEHCIQTLMCGGHPKGWMHKAERCTSLRSYSPRRLEKCGPYGPTHAA